jgi:hypothetical protein
MKVLTICNVSQHKRDASPYMKCNIHTRAARRYSFITLQIANSNISGNADAKTFNFQNYDDSNIHILKRSSLKQKAI